MANIQLSYPMSKAGLSCEQDRYIIRGLLRADFWRRVRRPFKYLLLALGFLICSREMCLGLEITTTSLPSGVEMVPYSAQLQATNGTLPYMWRVAEESVEQTSANSFSATGTAWQSGMDQTYSLSLPFTFPFYGQKYSTCYVDIHGNIKFSPPLSDWSPSTSSLASQTMIAVMWNDFFDYGSPVEIHVQHDATSSIIRWYRDGQVNVAATLRSDGSIELRYGTGNANGGLIGISSGDGANF